MIPIRIITKTHKYYFYNKDIDSIKKIVYKKLGDVKIEISTETPSIETFAGFEILGCAVIEKHTIPTMQEQLTFDLTN